MVKARKMWAYNPRKSLVPKVPTSVKAEVQQKADQLVETVLKPQHVKPPPNDYHFNYIINIHTKWYRHYFYFCAQYRVQGLHASVPSFETKFARLEHIGGNHFNLSFMRYTGEWIEAYPGLTLDKCLKVIQDDPLFQP